MNAGHDRTGIAWKPGYLSEVRDGIVDHLAILRVLFAHPLVEGSFNRLFKRAGDSISGAELNTNENLAKFGRAGKLDHAVF